jgi:hypothetical protein
MRGVPTPSGSTVYARVLYPNLSNAEEDGGGNGLWFTSTGFVQNFSTGDDTFIYIAIRRGPMKVPTVGTSVFAPVAATGTSTNTFYSSGGFAPDMLWNKIRTLAYGNQVWDKLRGVTQILTTSDTSAETNGLAGYDLVSFNNTGLVEGNNSSSVMNVSPYPYINYMFGRAPSFFDIVCYKGTGNPITFTHNLGVAPQWMIIKRRNVSGNGWCVYSSFLTATSRVFLQDNSASATQGSMFNDTEPTSSVFTVGTNDTTNNNTSTYVAYLFATCAGVSKCGNYTGNGTTQTINCGFTGGARFVLIKRTDSTGDWYTYDTARGMTTVTDPYFLTNSNAVETATLGSVTTVSTGFALDSTILAAINVNGGSYIFLAIA